MSRGASNLPAGDHPRITLSGYYGFANTGDEAILEATIDGIRRFAPEAQITVLSNTPGSDPNIAYLPRYQLRSILLALRAPGLFLSGGGGLFQDTTSRHSLFYYLAIHWLAKFRGMKTMVYAQGLGPLTRPSSRAAVRFVLRGADAITLRDAASAALLAEIGLPGLGCVTADPVFALDPAPAERVQEILRDEGIPGEGRRIAVALRPWPGLDEKREAVIIETLRLAVDRLDAHIIFIGMRSPGDQVLSDHLAERLDRPGTVIRGAYRPSEIAGILGQCDAVIAMRLHALILAAVAGTPSVAISYDPKVSSAALQLELPSLDIEQLDAQQLFRLTRDLLAAGETGRERIRSAALHQRDQSEKNFEIIQRLLT